MLSLSRYQRIIVYNYSGTETFGIYLSSASHHGGISTRRYCAENLFYHIQYRSFSAILHRQSSRSLSDSTMSARSKKKEPAIPRPSSRYVNTVKSPLPIQSLNPVISVVLISPENEVLLLHRVKTSTSFASAHVFPGGNISVRHDGEFTVSPEDPRRHYDAINYRRAAIRELFEESGILLARDAANPKKLVHVDEAEREKGRHDIHNNKIGFEEWLKLQNSKAEMDTGMPISLDPKL